MWKIKLEELEFLFILNLIFTACVAPAKFKFEKDTKSSSSNSIFQNMYYIVKKMDIMKKEPTISYWIHQENISLIYFEISKHPHYTVEGPKLGGKNEANNTRRSYGSSIVRT